MPETEANASPARPSFMKMPSRLLWRGRIPMNRSLALVLYPSVLFVIGCGGGNVAEETSQPQPPRVLVNSASQTRGFNESAVPSPAPIKPELALQAAHTSEIDAATFSPDGRYVLTGSHGSIKLFDVDHGVQLRSYMSGAPTWSLAFSPDGKSFISNFGPVSKPTLWDTATGKAIKYLEAPHPEFNTQSVSISPDGRTVLTAAPMPTTGDQEECVIFLWDARTGRAPATHPHRDDRGQPACGGTQAFSLQPRLRAGRRYLERRRGHL